MLGGLAHPRPSHATAAARRQKRADLGVPGKELDATDAAPALVRVPPLDVLDHAAPGHAAAALGLAGDDGHDVAVREVPHQELAVVPVPDRTQQELVVREVRLREHRDGVAPALGEHGVRQVPSAAARWGGGVRGEAGGSVGG